MSQIIYAGKHSITYTVSRHAHSSWELIYCTSGSGYVVFDSQRLFYQAGDIVIIPPYTAHSNESENGFTNIHLNFSDPSFNLKEPAVLKDNASHFILDAFSAAFYYFSNQPVPAILMSSYADLIINLVYSCMEAPKYSAVVIEIENSIIANYPDESFELDKYLQSLPFNYDYLRKLFRRETGMTPHQYLNDIRLQTAVKTLAIADIYGVNITEISHMCGISDPLYFSRMFRRKYGMSPTKYHEMLISHSAEEKNADNIKIQL